MAGRRIAKLTDECKFVDQHVYNDSTTLAIYTFAGDKSDSKIRSRKDAVERELAIGLELCQDDSYVMRVRLGAPTAVEKREFIGFASGYLDLSSGTLLSGESAFQVPKKKYRVEIMSFLPHSMACWQVEKLLGRSGPLGSYWRRTRPDESFPDWLGCLCSGQPQMDPGHEKEWRSRTTISEPERAYVDFLVCLLPPNSKKTISERNRDGLVKWSVRCPEICPKGIAAPDLELYDDEDF